MKKIIAIIIVLMLVFISMFMYNANQRKNLITVQEIEDIDTYITKIYMWRAVTKEALPNFENIDEVQDVWYWRVVEKNLEEYELTYDLIQQKSKEIFGDTKKEFPKEGTDYIKYSEETQKYYTTGIELSLEEDCYLLNKIEKTKDGYEVEIVEYILDYSNEETENYTILLKNLQNDIIQEIEQNMTQEDVKEIVKNNIDKFTKKTIVLEIRENKLIVRKIY